MILYIKVEKDGKQAIYEELEVVPSNQAIQLAAAYNYLMGTCGGMTPEVAAELLTLLCNASTAAPANLYGRIEES